MEEVKAKVIANDAVAEEYIRLVLAAPSIAAEAVPGQFVQVNCGGSVYSLMPRPISIHQVEKENLVLLIEIKGAGTQWLATRRPGDFVAIFGPLGRGFPLPAQGPAALVSGGIGIGPMAFLGRVLLEQGIDFDFLLGVRNRNGLALLRDVASLGITAQIATEDGSAGVKGYVTQLLAGLAPTVVYACGPEPMLRAVARWGLQTGVPTKLSLEARMACGVGACRGCVTKIKRDGCIAYENVCNCGPVFDGSEVVFDEEA